MSYALRRARDAEFRGLRFPRLDKTFQYRKISRRKY